MYKFAFIFTHLLCFNYAYSQSIKSATKKDFEEGIAAELFAKSHILKHLKNAVLVKNCMVLKNKYGNKDNYQYNPIGIIKHVPAFVVVEKTLYNGHQFLLINTTSCKRYCLNGYPFKLNNKIICFNELETTDRMDTLYIWTLNHANQLVLEKRIPIPNDKKHLDGNNNVRFSKNGRSIIYKTYDSFYYSVHI